MAIARFGVRVADHSPWRGCFDRSSQAVEAPAERSPYGGNRTPDRYPETGRGRCITVSSGGQEPELGVETVGIDGAERNTPSRCAGPATTPSQGRRPD